jgi:hypothetical protein
MSDESGVVWSEMWNGFALNVIKDVSGKFRSLAKSPWHNDAFLCCTSYDTLDQAKGRCWGMVKQDCEVVAGQAHEEMKKQNAPLHGSGTPHTVGEDVGQEV